MYSAIVVKLYYKLKIICAFIQEWTGEDTLAPVALSDGGDKSGMVTAVRLAVVDNQAAILSAYESGQLLLSFISDNKIEGVAQFQFAIHDFVPLSLEFDSEKLIGVVAGSQDKVITFKISEKCFSILTERTMPSKGISSLCLRRHDRKILIATSWDSTVKLFSWIKPEKLKPLAALKFHTDSVEAVTCTKYPVEGIKLKGHLIAAGSKDQKISLWSVYNDI
jgi:WD40 repeat protein